jgi:hypothetical protein
MTVIPEEGDNMTIIASTICLHQWSASYPAMALAAMESQTRDAIAGSGATQIFVMEGTPMKNKRCTTCPLKVTLADGQQVWTTHMCYIDIPSLPYTLTGHITPNLSITSIFGICVLTAVCCTVTFDKDKCGVTFNGKGILHGYKDPRTILWALPLSRERHVRLPNMTQSCLCWPAPIWPVPICAFPCRPPQWLPNQHYSPTPSAPTQTASNFPTNCYAAHAYTSSLEQELIPEY